MSDKDFFNLLVGIVMGSFLPSQQKQEVVERVREIEYRLDGKTTTTKESTIK